MTALPTVIVIDSVDARERGRQRGLALRKELAAGIRVYLDLFAACGIGLAEVRSGADTTLAATERWYPALVDEMRGVAEGAEVPLWQIAALNARTEILSGANGAKPGECSTIVNAGIDGPVAHGPVGTHGPAGAHGSVGTHSPVGAQTWDWHEELAGHWHLQRVRGTPREFVGLTEHGILSKVGINDAGVGILLNILGHRADRADGVPVHLVGARVLAEASTLMEAVELLRTAPVSTSSAITVLSPDGAATVELSPLGAAVVSPGHGVLLHTNHFLDTTLSEGEKPGLYDPDSQLRLAVLVDRVDRTPLPSEAEGLVAYLVSEPGDAAALCCVPEPDAVLGDRWATLATVTLDARRRTMTVSAGSPAQLAENEVQRLTAGA